jgi:putative hydrolase of the HAD superfamily
VSLPSVLLFDLGGVLVHNTGPRRLAELTNARCKEDVLASRWLTSPAARAFEVGTLEPAEFARQMIAEWRLGLDPQQFLAEFAAWPKGLYPGAAELLSRLRADFRLACLSNSNSLHWPRLQALLPGFDLCLSSHELGRAKPDAACFASALDRLAISPRKVAFFDDAPANVAAARAIGMQAFRVNGPEDVRARLDAEGWTRRPNLSLT